MLSELVKQRYSCRAYTNQSVDVDTVKQIIATALQSNSGSNLQPWQVYAVAGNRKAELIKNVGETAMLNPTGEADVDIPIYPNPLPDTYKARRNLCGETLYAALGIEREDKMGRLTWAFKNFEFFGAPVGLIITMNRDLSESQLIDIGMFLQLLQLTAVEQGLATCLQASWTMFPEAIRQSLQIDHQEMVVCGVSLGYPDTDQAVNTVRQARQNLDDVLVLKGF